LSRGLRLGIVICHTVSMSVKKIFYNTLLQSVGKLISIVIGLVVVGMLTGYLGSTGFGEYATVISFMGFWGILADLGLYLVATKEISEVGADENKILGNVFSLRIISVFLILLLGALVAQLFPYSAAVKETMFIAILAFAFVSGTQVLVGVFQKHLVFYELIASEVLGRIAMLVSTWFFIHQRLSLPSFILSLTLANGVHFLLSYYLVRRLVPFTLQFDFKFWKKILSKSWPLAFSVIFNLIYFKGDSVILSVYRPPQDVGLYSLAYKFLEVPLAFPAMFAGLIMPFLARFSFRDWASYRLYLQKSLDAILLLVVPLTLTTYFFARPIVNLVGGEIYPDADRVLQILIFATAIIYIGQLFGYAVVALDRQKTMQWGYLGGAMVGLVLYFILIPRYSYFGAAAATVLIELMVACIAVLITSRAAHFFPSFSILAKALIAGLPMALFFHYVNFAWRVNFFSTRFTTVPAWMSEAIIGLVIYTFLLFVLRAVPRDFIAEILGSRPGAAAELPIDKI